jgi:hypothetical protein
MHEKTLHSGTAFRGRLVHVDALEAMKGLGVRKREGLGIRPHPKRFWDTESGKTKRISNNQQPERSGDRRSQRMSNIQGENWSDTRGNSRKLHENGQSLPTWILDLSVGYWILKSSFLTEPGCSTGENGES